MRKIIENRGIVLSAPGWLALYVFGMVLLLSNFGDYAFGTCTPPACPPCYWPDGCEGCKNGCSGGTCCSNGACITGGQTCCPGSYSGYCESGTYCSNGCCCDPGTSGCSYAGQCSGCCNPANCMECKDGGCQNKCKSSECKQCAYGTGSCVSDCDPALCQECVNGSCLPCGGTGQICCNGQCYDPVTQECCGGAVQNKGNCMGCFADVWISECIPELCESCVEGICQECGGDPTKCCVNGECKNKCFLIDEPYCDSMISECGCDSINPEVGCEVKRKKWSVGFPKTCNFNCAGGEAYCNRYSAEIPCYKWQWCETLGFETDSFCTSGFYGDYCQWTFLGWCQECSPTGAVHTELINTHACE